MREDCELRSQVENWLAQNEAIRSAFPDQSAKPGAAGWTVADWLLVPDLPRQNAKRATEGGQIDERARIVGHVGERPHKPGEPPAALARKGRARARRMLPGLAAAVALWAGAAILLSGNGGAPFAKAATAAYRTFAEGRARPVEIATTDRDALNRWFSAQMSGAAPIPDLKTSGLALIGGRIVPGASSPAAFLIYESPRRERFAIAMEAVDAPPETDLAIDDSGGVLCASWTGAGHSFAIVGRASRGRLAELARLVREGGARE
jgi:anti-sigma factor RsiW